MRKLICLVLLLESLVFTHLSTLAQDAITIEAVTYTDDLNREVIVPVPLTSVITLAPSLTETLYFLGAEELISAADINSDYPESISNLPRVTGWDSGINLEKLTALQPDLILASEMTSFEDINSMEELGLTVFCIKNPADFPELFESILTIAEIVGKTPEGESLITEMENRISVIEAHLADVKEKPSVFYEIDATDPAKPWTAGKGTFISELIQMAGGKNIGDALEGEWVQISLEALLKADPQIILLGDSMYGATAQSAAKRIGWSDISAVKNRMLYEFDDNLVTRPGPRLVEGFELIARMIHPESFTEK